MMDADYYCPSCAFDVGECKCDKPNTGGATAMKMTEDEAIAYLRHKIDGTDLPMEAIRTVCDALEAQRRAVPDVSTALKVMSDAMNADPDFAWSWHCNVAMTAQDAGAPHDRANVWAANFMQRAFDVDTLTRVNKELTAAAPAQPALSAPVAICPK